ncbi:MAG: OmpH family outer membrane protein [bacterium]
MNNLKSLFIAMSVTFICLFTTMASYSETLGVVDLNKILANYAKAQNVSADLKVKEADLQKFVADAQKQLKGTANPMENKKLEDKLTAELNSRAANLKEEQTKQLKQVEDNINQTITAVAKAHKIDVVFNRASIVLGGTDLTDEILTTLNADNK